MQTMTRIRIPAVFAAIFFAAIFLATVPAALPQTSGEADLRKQVDTLTTEVKALRTELDQVKATLQNLTGRQNPTLDISALPITGDPKAKVVMVEFSDYQCPFCMDYYSNVYHTVVDEYVKTGKIRYAARDFPGESIHPMALKSAEAARCANEQDKFWEMHDQLFNNQKTLASTGIADAAKASGLNLQLFQTCFSSGRYTAAVKKDEAEIAALGVQGTPAFFVGTPDPANPAKIRLTNAVVGSQPIENFRKIFDTLLPK